MAASKAHDFSPTFDEGTHLAACRWVGQESSVGQVPGCITRRAIPARSTRITGAAKSRTPDAGFGEEVEGLDFGEAVAGGEETL